MAKLYGEIAAKSLLTLDKSFARANGQPLDASEVYYSLEAAKTYAAGAQAYIGQKIVVVEDGVVTHYSIEDTNGTLKELGCKPVGDESSITVSDEGVVSLKGVGSLVFERDVIGQDGEPTGEKEEVQFQPLMTKNGLVWVEPSKTTAEGLATLIDALAQRMTAAETDIDALEAKVGKAAEGEEASTGLFKAIDDEVTRATAAEKALGERIDAIDFVDNDELTEAIKDFATKTFVADEVAKIEVPVLGVDANDKILSLGEDKLLSAVVALAYDEDNKAIKLTGKNGADLGSIDATPFIKDGMLTDAHYDADTKELVFTWNTDAGVQVDRVPVGSLVDTYTAGNGLDLANNEFSIKVAEGNESFLSVDASGIKLSGVQTAIDNAKSGAILDAEGKIATAKQEAIDAAAEAVEGKGYAVATEVEEAYAKKATTLAGYGITDAYTATQTDEAIRNKISEMTGGESAADVLGLLNDYKAANDREVWGDDFVNNATVEGKYTPTYSGNSRVDDALIRIVALESVHSQANVIEAVKVNGEALVVGEDKSVDITVPTLFSQLTDDSGFDSRITAAQSQADKGVTDASAAQTTANEAKEIASNNSTLIGQLTTTVSGHTTTINDHASRIAGLEDFKAAHISAYDTLNGIVSGHTSAIAGKAEQTDLDAAVLRIAANETAIKSINENTIPAINESISKKADGDKVYTKDEINSIVGNVTEGKTIVEMIEAAQQAAEYDDTSIKADIKKNTDAITTLNGDATVAGSVAKIADDRIAAALAGADADFDTLKEMSDWLSEHSDSAATMNSAIEENTRAIAKLNGSVDIEGSVLAMIKANAPTVATNTLLGLVMSSEAENKISVASDGTMEVNSLNVNKLTQTEGEFMILNGGNANN